MNKVFYSTVFSFLILTLFSAPVRSNKGGMSISMIQQGCDGLPDGCVAVEYLESTGEAHYIDTGIVIDDNYYSISCDMIRVKNATTSYGRYWGSYSGEQKGCTRMINAGTGDNLFVQYRRVASGGNTAPGYAGFDYLKIRTTFVLSNGLFQYFRNGKLYYSLSISETNSTDEDTIKIFGTGTYMKLFGFQIKHYDELILNMIPVRYGNIGCLFDKISGLLFFNEGDGEFIVGPDA